MATKKSIRMTGPVLKVLAMLVEAYPKQISGSDVFNKTKMFSGTLYPILARLLQAGWVDSEWEDVDPAEAGRPRRRLYRLTNSGLGFAKREIASIHAVTSPPAQTKPARAQSWGGAPKWT